MSIPVPLLRLRAAMEERGAAGYLLTVSDDGVPHAVHVPVHVDCEQQKPLLQTPMVHCALTVHAPPGGVCGVHAFEALQ